MAAMTLVGQTALMYSRTFRRILFILIRYIDDRMQEGCMDKWSIC